MGTPKALLRYRQESFLDTQIGLLAGRCETVIVVLGAAAKEIRAATRRAAVLIENENWETGQTGSLQCGLRAVPRQASGVLFTLVDHPAVKIGTVDRLLRFGEQEAPPGRLLRVPRYNGQNGHPVWLAQRLIPEFLALGESDAARDVVHAHVGETDFIEVQDPGILTDVDDPAAYRALLEAEA